MRTRASHKSRFADSSESFHIRLCHFCMNLNESNTVVQRCDRCGRTLTNSEAAHALYRQVADQLDLNEDGDGLEALEDAMADEDSLEEMESTISEALPINGLSVVW